MNIGETYLIPSGKKFWCIKIQKTIQLDVDLIVEVVATTVSKDSVFAKGKMLFFAMGPFPTLVDDNSIGEVYVPLEELIPYALPVIDDQTLKSLFGIKKHHES